MKAVATIARGTFVPGGAQVLRVAPDGRGWVAGRVEIDPDELPGDDLTEYVSLR